MTQKALAERQVVSTDGVPSRTVALSQRRAGGQAVERLVSLFSPLLLLLLWEALVRVGLLDSRFFPAPSHVLGTFWRLISFTVSATSDGLRVTGGELWGHIGISLLRALVGFLIGAVPGLIIGLSMGLFPIVRAGIWPMVGALYPIPKIAILPLVMLLFGLGESSKWAIIAIGVFFPILINSMAGVMNIESIYHDVGRNFGASRLNRYLTIALPGALPLVITGVRLAWGVALLLIVAAEFVAAKSGLGFLIWQSWQTFAVEEMYVGIIAISMLGYLSFVLLDEASKILVPWRPNTLS